MVKNESSRIIDELGGTVAVAALFRLTKGAIAQWRDKGIPEARLMYLRVAHPELFEKGTDDETEADSLSDEKKVAQCQ